MKKARPILLLVDNRTRDSHGMLLIHYWLRHLGCSTVLCNKRNWLVAFQAHRPSVVVLPHTVGEGMDEFLTQVSKITRVVVVPTEGAIPVREDAVAWASGRKNGIGAFVSGLTKVFVWGPKSAHWLLESEVYREDQVVVSGTPRLDPYLVSSEHRVASNHSGLERGIGFAGDYGHINTYNRTNMISLVEERRNVNADIFYDVDRNIEDYVWFLTACLRVDLDIIDRWTNLDKKPVYMRPDPFERLEGYSYIRYKYPHLTVSNQEPLWQWLLHVSCLVTNFSSTGIEALLSGIPVVSPLDIIGERLSDHMRLKTLNTPFRSYYWQPKTYDEATELLLAADRGELAPSPKPQEFSRYLKDFYDWPRAEPSSLTIAKELASIAGDDAANGTFVSAQKRHSQYKVWSLRARAMGLDVARHNMRRIKYKLPRLGVDLAYVLNDFRQHDFRAMQRYHFYHWWHREDFRRSKRVWNALRTIKHPTVKTESRVAEDLPSHDG